MDRPNHEACEKHDFRDAIGVEVSETDHGLSHDSVQVSELYEAVGPIYAVLRRDMIRHIVGALEPEHL